MRVKAEKLNSAVNKVTDLTSGDKTVSSILLRINEDTMSVAYSDSKKAVVEVVPVEREEGDITGEIAVPYELFKQAVKSCQPSGSIVIDEITLEFNTEKSILNLVVTLQARIGDADGNFVGLDDKGKQTYSVKYSDPKENKRSEILVRENYDKIFEPSVLVNTFSREELVDVFTRTATEKGQKIYLSKVAQTAFSSSQAHVTCVPLRCGKDFSDEEVEALKENIIKENDGQFNEEQFNQKLKELGNRLSYSVTMSYQDAKSLIAICNSFGATEYNLYAEDKSIYVYAESDEGSVGMRFLMQQALKTHIEAMNKYEAMKYDKYQLVFERDFLDRVVKSAVEISKDPNMEIVFKYMDELEEMHMSIKGGSASSSTSNNCDIRADACVDRDGDLDGRKFIMSAKVLTDMISQLKTQMVVFDFDCTGDSVCVRMAELDMKEFMKSFSSMREAMKTRCEQNGVEFDPETTPTDLDLKLEWSRKNCLLTRQYTMLSKQK